MSEPRALRWGHRSDRLVLGLALILGGGLGLQGTSPYILWLLAAGALMHIAGWAILPTDGWRRIVAGIASSVAVLLVLTGPQALWMLSVPCAGWLLTRRRPALAYVTVVLPLASGILLAALTREYEQLPWTLPIQVAVVVGAAWIAALFAHSGARRAPGGPVPSGAEG